MKKEDKNNKYFLKKVYKHRRLNWQQFPKTSKKALEKRENHPS